MEGEAESSITCLIDVREDGWLMAELYQFTSTRRNMDLEILFEGINNNNCFWVEGIEFRPIEKVKHEVLEDEKEDMQPISDSDTDWEQKLPSDYEKIIKWSDDNVQWTTNKELYFLLCKGFLVHNRELWFFLSKNGKRCYMLPAREALQKEKWSWKSLTESRFEEVAFNPIGIFSIICNIKSQILSPSTTYASYLVYKLPENISNFKFPLKVKYTEFEKNDYESTVDMRFIYLSNPQTPVIKPKVDQKTHNPIFRPKTKGIPRQRNDGWMEVEISEIQTGTTIERILMRADIETFFDNKLDGLTVQGIEFRSL